MPAAPAAEVRKPRAALFGLSTTRRAAVFATVVCALALSVSVPLRTYLSQRSDVAAQEQKQADLRREVDELERRRAELADPAHVRAEARTRLRYVMPGETPYMVELPGQTGGGPVDQTTTAPPRRGAWYEDLWDSVNGK
nr:septum formation initiator family protein [Actinokineospora bangkokensis]